MELANPEERLAKAKFAVIINKIEYALCSAE
jgi:hypothetical protein